MTQEKPTSVFAGANGPAHGENFNDLIGMRMVCWEPGYTRIELDLRPVFHNSSGIVHGGVLMTLLDTASGCAGMYAAEGEERRGCSTIAFNSKFIKPAVSGTLVAEARVEGGGKSVFFTHAEIRDAAGDLVATGDGTFRYRRMG